MLRSPRICKILRTPSHAALNVKTVGAVRHGGWRGGGGAGGGGYAGGHTSLNDSATPAADAQGAGSPGAQTHTVLWCVWLNHVCAQFQDALSSLAEWFAGGLLSQFTLRPLAGPPLLNKGVYC